MPERPDHADAVIAALADRQHGLVSRIQLLAAGITERQIHWSSATLLRMRNGRGPRSHVTVPRRRRSLETVTFHFSDLPEDETAVESGIPATTPARTLVDLAPSLPGPSLARMLDAAEQRGAPLAALVERYPRRAGVAKLRAIIGGPNPWTRSDLEGWFLEALDAAGIERPRVNATVAGHEVDFAWPARRVIVELDAYATHGSPLAFERDRERDRRLTAAGWRVIRVTEGQRDAALADLRRLLGASAGRSPSPRAAA